MSLRTVTRNPFISCCVIILFLVFAASIRAQTEDAADSAKKLTVQRIYSEPSLSGHTLRGMTWTPDGKRVSFLESKKSNAEEGDEDGGENGPHLGKTALQEE